VATQAILFGHPELKIFEDEKTRGKTLAYLAKMIALSADLGAKATVFGSPKNRRINGLDAKKAFKSAVDFFSKIAQIAEKHQIYFCLEPNPPVYGADFILNTEEALVLIEEVIHPYLRLNLDTGILTINKENYRSAIEKGFEFLAHLHISEPQLSLIGEKGVNHHEVAKTLKDLNYKGWVSVEMKNNLSKPNTVGVEKALSFVSRIYN